MDVWNLRDLKSMQPIESSAQLYRLGEFVENCDKIRDVYDPYFVRNFKKNITLFVKTETNFMCCYNFRMEMTKVC
jgi:hypothetical protein